MRNPFKKREIKAYLMIFESHVFDTHGYLKIYLSSCNSFDALVDAYDDGGMWMNTYLKQTINLYDDDVKKLIELGYDIPKTSYRQNTNFRDYYYSQKWSKRKTLKYFPKLLVN